MTPPLPDIPVAFVAQIDAHPGDPGPPAVLSDWLAERGWWAWENVLGWVLACPGAGWPRWLAARWFEASGDAARAEFVRVQCELAQIEAIEHDCDPDLPWAEPTCPACGAFGAAEALAVRGRELIESHWIDWLAGLLPDPVMGHPVDSGSCVFLVGNVRVEFRRGFVEEITCAAADWLAHAGVLTAAAPVRVVRFTDEPNWAAPDAHIVWKGMRHPDRSGKTFTCERWPGATFELPPPPPARGTATIGGVTVPIVSWELQPGPVPIENIRRAMQGAREVSGEFTAVYTPQAAPAEVAPPSAPAWAPGETGRPRPNSRRPDWYDNRRRRGRRRR